MLSRTAFVPSDPLVSAQWHLRQGNGVDLNVYGAWAQGYTGRGVAIAVYDDGIERWHPDLSISIDTSKAVVINGNTLAGEPLPGAAHGTSVTGIIAAEANGIGGVGVAPGARLTGVDIFRIDGWTLFEAMNGQRGFDVVNHSWGWIDPFADRVRDPGWTRFYQGLESAVDDGRGGLGTIMVVAAGNGRESGSSTNLSGFNASRTTIDVAAMGQDGQMAFYSSPGASILVSAPSSSRTGGIVTTDRTGNEGYQPGDVMYGFGGTSAAAPMVSGVVALMLEANPSLGWRDVQTILAATARPTSDAVQNAGVGVNGHGFAFSNNSGFGLVDANAAVKVAQGFTETAASFNERLVTGSTWGARSVPDGISNGTAFDVQLAGGVRIENLELTFERGSFGRASDIIIDVRSPSGSWSRLLDRNGGDAALPGGVLLGSNAFRGETSGGTWTVVIRDVSPGATGFVEGLTLQAFGSDEASARTIFTDAFSASGVRTLSDKGLDTIDFSALSEGAVLDLTNGWGVVAGRTIGFAPGTIIERVVGTFSDDVIAGGTGRDRFVEATGLGSATLHWGAVDSAGGQIIRFYDVALGRLPDMDGFSYWVGRLQAGTAFSEIARAAINSPEFTSRYGSGLSNDAYVDVVYRNALGRSPDPEGTSYWAGRLDAGLTREDLLVGFAESVEKRLGMDTVAVVNGPTGRDRLTGVEQVQFRDGMVSLELDDAIGRAWRLYDAGLDRMPDQNGLKFYADRLSAGVTASTIAREMLASPEATALYGSAGDNSSFAAAIYQNVLDRAPDPAGVSYWTGRLDAGLTREDLLVAFAEAPEFKLKIVDQHPQGLKIDPDLFPLV
jgi:subtilisin-like proprotein convertase family protein